LPRRAPAAAAADSFSIHSLVGATAPPASPPGGHRQPARRPTTTSGGASSPFLVRAAAAHAQYYALAASGLLGYGAGSTRLPPLDWRASTGLAAKHRYGV